MLGLENELIRPVNAQCEDPDVQKHADALALVMSIKAKATTHIGELEQQLEALGGHAASGLKTGVASILGAAATAIDNVRKTEVSKDLRDDYTALSLACISYSMLYATAVALDNQTIAALAKRSLSEYATCIMRISDVMPGIVIAELQVEGVAIDPTKSQSIKQSLTDAWQQSVVEAGKAA